MKLRKNSWVYCLAAAVLLGVLLTGCSGSTGISGGSTGSSGSSTGTTGNGGSSSTIPAYTVDADEKTITATDGSWKVKVTEDEENNSSAITKTYATALDSLNSGAFYVVVADAVANYTDASRCLERVLAIPEENLNTLNDLDAALLRSVLTETDGIFYVTLRFQYDANSALQEVSVCDPAAADGTFTTLCTVQNDSWTLKVDDSNEWMIKLKPLLTKLSQALKNFLLEQASAAQGEAKELQALVDAELTYVMARGTCGDSLKWTLDNSGLLTISGRGEMSNYSYDAPWYTYRSLIKEVKLEDGVTSIGEYAFSYCSFLTSVTISDSVTSIGNSAFWSCSSLTSITIPNSVTRIGYGAFYDCSSLTSITIPDSVTSISGRAFSGCSFLTSVTIPDSVTSIGWYAFSYCSSLTSVTIPDSVTSIGNYAFSGCSSLTSITIPDSVTSIGNYAFSYCSFLTSVTIPDSVTSIGEYAFYNCSSLTSITIPASVTSIGYSAFSGCSSLTDVYYAGDKEAWVAISKGVYNDALTRATIHYNYTPESADE